MTDSDFDNDSPIPDRKALSAWFSSVSHSESLIGTEHEKLLFHRNDLRPPNYPTIRALLEDLHRKTQGSHLVRERGKPIGLKLQEASISIEPAGQLEFAGAPMRSVHGVCDELNAHLRSLRPVLDALDLGMCAIGARPRESVDELPWMPKQRYDIMRAYMPSKGALGVIMMGSTATVQVNIDFRDEQDMIEKMRIATVFQPVVTALYAHSPYRLGRRNGLLSNRAHYWLDIDPDRSGMPLFVFREDFGFDLWRDYTMALPMYCLEREGRYHETTRFLFKDYLEGTSEEVRALRARFGEARWGDWEGQVRTVFPEVRLKRFIEMRGADSGDPLMLCALSALWAGLLYDDQAQQEALAMAMEIAEDLPALSAAHREVPRLALATRCGKRSFQELALRLLTVAEAGLQRRSQSVTPRIKDERPFLSPLLDLAEEGSCPAQRMLEAFPAPSGLEAWSALYESCAY